MDSAPVAHYTEKRRIDGDAGVSCYDGPRAGASDHLLEAGAAIEIADSPARHAFMALRRSSFRPFDDEERSRDHFLRIAALLDGVPVRRLSYPRICRPWRCPRSDLAIPRGHRAV
jgi:hypothetical protein